MLELFRKEGVGGKHLLGHGLHLVDLKILDSLQHIVEETPFKQRALRLRLEQVHQESDTVLRGLHPRRAFRERDFLGDFLGIEMSHTAMTFRRRGHKRLKR